MKCGQPKHARLLSLVIEALSLSLILSFEKERGLEDRSRSLDLSLWLGLVKTGRASRWNVPVNQRVHLKKACTVGVGVADPGARSRSRTGSGWWHGALPCFFDEKEVLSWLHCTCNRKKMPHKTKWLWKVGPQVLPARIFHKRSPLFQQECLRQGLHCTLEAHESCTFCAGRLIAGKVIKTLQTWRYVWSFTNLWRLNVIKWAVEITNLYKKFNNILQAEAEKLSGFTPSIIQPEAAGRGLYARCKTR